MPPPTDGSGSFEPSRVPPHMPSGGGGGGEFRQPEMLGRPVEDGMNRPQGGSYEEEYKRQYEQEARRQTEQRTREMRERYAPPQRDGEFHPQGQPFMEGGRDNTQGRPFMGESRPNGRPFGGGDEFGGSEENQEEVERKMEEREKLMEQERLRQMKRGMSGMERGLKQIRKMMDNLSRKGLTVPADAQTLIQELQAALDIIKDATELNEEIEAAMEVIQDKGSDLGELGQKIGMIERLSQMTKQVSKEFAKIDKMVAKVKKSKAGREFAEAVAKVEEEVGALKAEWERVRSAIAAGEEDGDDIRDTMDGFFEKVGDIHRSLELVRQLGSISKMIKSANKEIAMAEREIARHRKAGKDVTRLEELLAAAKVKIAEVKALVVQRGFDPDDLFSLMQELRRIGDEAEDELERVSGRMNAKELGASVIQALTLRRLGL